MSLTGTYAGTSSLSNRGLALEQSDHAVQGLRILERSVPPGRRQRLDPLALELAVQHGRGTALRSLTLWSVERTSATATGTRDAAGPAWGWSSPGPRSPTATTRRTKPSKPCGRWWHFQRQRPHATHSPRLRWPLPTTTETRRALKRCAPSRPRGGRYLRCDRIRRREQWERRSC